MKVFISADMEGVAGVSHRDHLVPGGNDYAAARRWFTGEVNAAVKGAVEAGAEEVWVNDGHATMRNLLIDELHPASRLVVGPATSSNKPLIQVTGIEHDTFDACIMIGFHSRAGTPGGLLSHTWVGARVHEIRLQGVPAGEVTLNAAIVGHFGVPVVLVTGADDLCREVQGDLGKDLRVVETKKALGATACASLTPRRAQELILVAAKEAVEARKERKPFRLEPPLSIEVDYHRRQMAARALETGEGNLGNTDRTVVYEGKDVPSIVKSLWRGLEMSLREDATFLA